MPRIGLVGPTYQSQSLNTDAQECINFYPEVDESGAGNAPIVLHPTPGTKKFVDLTRVITPQVDGVLGFEQSTTATGNGTAVSTGALNPVNANDWAFESMTPANVAAPWTALDASTNSADQPLVGTPATSAAATLASSHGWVAALLLFKKLGVGNPALVQKVGRSGAYIPPVTFSLANPVVRGNTIIVVNEYIQQVSGTVTISDNLGNVYVNQASIFGNSHKLDVFVCQNALAGTPTFTINGTASGITQSAFAYEIQAGSAAITQSGPVRGQLNIAGRSFAVSGSDFDEVLANGTFINWGTVANDSKPVTMAATPQQLLLASAGTAYVFDLMANTLTAIPGATFAGPVSQAEVCDNFFILTIKNTKQFYVSAPLNANDWVTNGTAIISVFPNNLVSMKVFQRQIWFDSDVESVVYYDSGNIFPFDVNPNAFINYGSVAENGMSVFNNTIAWLGRDKNGQGKVWQAQGYTPVRISNHAIEFAIQSYARMDDAVAFTYQDQGHEFLCFYFPTPSVMWVYDATTSEKAGVPMWHKQGFWVGAIGDFRAAHRQNHAFSFGRHLVGDWQSAVIYEMKIPQFNAGAWTFADDDGAPLHRLRRAAHISNEQKRLYLNELQVFAETGLGPQPPLLDGAGNPREPSMDMRLSRDSAHTWSSVRTRGCGFSGEFAKRIRWLRLGQARDFVIEIHVSDPIGWRITDAYINPPQQGEN